jgi:hypothetical protein
MPESKTSTSVFAFIRAVSRHWLTLMGGGAITVALGVFERFSGKNVPLWVYVSILIFFVFFACYLAWRDAKRELANYDNVESRRREYRANRLQSLLDEAGTVEYGWVSLDPGEGLERSRAPMLITTAPRISSGSNMGQKPQAGMTKRNLNSLNHYWQIAIKIILKP